MYISNEMKLASKYKAKHPQVIVEGTNSNGSWKVKCDIRIADIISELNNAGLETLYSCQGPCSLYYSYIMVTKPEEPKMLELCDKLIFEHWSNRDIEVVVSNASGNNRITYYIKGKSNDRRRICRKNRTSS